MVFAVVRRVIKQANREFLALRKSHHPSQELAAVAAAFGAVVQVEHQPLAASDPEVTRLAVLREKQGIAQQVLMSLLFEYDNPGNPRKCGLLIAQLPPP